MTDFIWVKDITKYPEYCVKIFGVKVISKELGINLFHDDCDEWLLALQGDELLGFSGYENTKSSFILKRAYVFENYRRFNIYRKMLELRLEKAKVMNVKVITATTTQMSKEEFIKRGFFTLKQYKKYQTYRLIL
jgi:hypothetical protein